MRPLGPNGAQSRLQQLPQPSHNVPSTPPQSDEPVGGVAQVPTLAPAGMSHAPEQQSAACAQTSPVWMHQETPSAQLPATQLFEQQSPSVAQLLPEVRQLALSAAHEPPVHVPLQHSEPVVHLSPSEMQASAEQVPPSQRSEQQLVAFVHAEPAAVQVVKADWQVPEVASHCPEQQSLPA